MAKESIPILLICILNVITGCASSSSAVNERIQESKDLVGNSTSLPLFTIDRSINSSLPVLNFKLYGTTTDDNWNNVDKIVVSKAEGSHQVMQEITFDDTTTPDKESFGLVVEDMNFDGYSDIRIQADTPAAPNIPYYYWLWDIQSSQFVRNTDLEQITSPEFDSKNKVITSFGRSSAAEHFRETYKYVNGIPTLLRRMTEIIDPEAHLVHYVVEERVDNSVKVTKKYDESL